MTKKVFLSFWLFLVMLFGSGIAWSQQSVQWQSSMRSIVFQSDEFVINYFDGTQDALPLSNVRSLLFTEGATTSFSGEPAGTDNQQVLITASELLVKSAQPVKALTVISMNGRALRQTNSESLNISTLPKGMYLLRIETATTVDVQKFIKP